MSGTSPQPSPLEAITDEMLVRMMVMILKDVAHLAPFLARIKALAANPDHPAFGGAGQDPATAAIAKRARMQQVEAVVSLVEMMLTQHGAHMRLMSVVDKGRREAAVTRAMMDFEPPGPTEGEKM